MRTILLSLSRRHHQPYIILLVHHLIIRVHTIIDQLGPSFIKVQSLALKWSELIQLFRYFTRLSCKYWSIDQESLINTREWQMVPLLLLVAQTPDQIALHFPGKTLSCSCEILVRI